MAKKLGIALILVYCAVVCAVSGYFLYFDGSSKASHNSESPVSTVQDTPSPTTRQPQETTIYVAPPKPVIKDDGNARASKKPQAPTTTSTVRKTTSQKKKPQQNALTGGLYSLAGKSGEYLGDSGLLPGTHILVVKEKSRDRVVSDSCTIAFSLPMKNGGYGAVTAGHCGTVGNEVYSIPTSQYFDSATKLGVITQVSSPRDYEGAGDWAIIELNSDQIHPPVQAQVPLALDLGEVKMDSKVCKNGSKTGFGCGIKDGEGVKVNLEGFTTKENPSKKKIVGIMDKATLCSLPGDSGSPIYDNNGIVGILSSSSASEKAIAAGKCDTSSSTYYTPIKDVIQQMKKRGTDLVLP